MSEKTLSDAIDQLAQQKAEQFIKSVRSDITNALKPWYRHEVAGGHFMDDDIRAVLLAMSQCVGRPDHFNTPKPTKTLVNCCRATIINNLLNGLPKIRELALMLTDSEEKDAYQGAGHEGHHKD